RILTSSLVALRRRPQVIGIARRGVFQAGETEKDLGRAAIVLARLVTRRTGRVTTATVPFLQPLRASPMRFGQQPGLLRASKQRIGLLGQRYGKSEFARMQQLGVPGCDASAKRAQR